MRIYSLRKSRQIMKTAYSWYQKKGHTLPSEQKKILEAHLEQLDKAFLQQDREGADAIARKLEEFCKQHCKKSIFDYTKELIFALIIALAIATVVRQMWFELYEIPTGSMRPTFKEQDHLTVSKLAFGINTPLQTSHLYFNPDLVQRLSVVILTGDKIPFIDEYTTYFGFLPYKKRFIKRLMGKPGDRIYFYGGKLYTIDKDDNLVEELLDSRWLHGLEHVPFLTFEGRLSQPDPTHIQFHQMNKPIGRLTLADNGSMTGQVFNGNEWVDDQPFVQKDSEGQIHTYSDVLGIGNFAMARLLTKDQLKEFTSLYTDDLEDAPLYLQLHHHPNLTFPKPRLQHSGYGFTIQMTPSSSVIPLQQHHLDALMDQMYTARFVVQDGRARRYSIDERPTMSSAVPFKTVPDGRYEFYYGKALKVGWGAVTSELPKDHPLYKKSPENIQKLFNLGIDFDTVYAPTNAKHPFPHRYAYFRNGDLYLLGAPILKADDPTLVSFLEKENSKAQGSSEKRPYTAFKDYGPPNKKKITNFGMLIPDHHYLLLGDNHAMSSDSRVFGFVPQQNLQGAPSLILWPPGHRWGQPEQKPYPIVNVQRIVVWSIALLIALLWYAYHRRQQRKPLFIHHRDTEIEKIEEKRSKNLR